MEDLSVFPEYNPETIEQCHFCESFPFLTELKHIVAKHGEVLFQPFDQEGMRCTPMDIELKEEVSLRMQPCRFVRSPVLEQLRELIDQFESQGVLVRDASCEFASPLVIVPKPDGSIRMAVDYREVNTFIRGTANQLPFQPLLFQTMGGSRYFAKMDNLWGYHQLRLSENSTKYTSIITPWGIYRFTACPFGICTAPGIYQDRMANEILRDVYLKGAVVYIDDTMVYSKDPNQFLQILDQTLGLMAEANVRLKPSKCFFGFPEIEFLGQLINGEGYRMTDARIQGIRDMPEPSSVKAVRSFVGMVNYCRNYIPNLSARLAPLTELTKTKVSGRSAVFELTKAARTAFLDVKDIIAQYTTLTAVTEVEPLILYTDASQEYVAAVLMQEQGDEEKPVAWVSHKLSPQATRWSMVELELYALVFAVTTLQPYLLGRKFLVRTDSRNLVHLANSTVAKLIRWRIQLSEFNFVLQHIPGVDNKLADGLTRVFRVSDIVGEDNGKLSEQQKLQHFQSVHNSIVGHLGVERTVEMLNAMDITWANIHEDITRFVRSCGICQKIKPQRIREHDPSGEHVLHSKYPMESLSIDTVGPLPQDQMGNQFIIAIVDNFSKFIGLYPATSTSAEEYLRAIMAWIGVFGVPKKIRTDGGSQFTAHISQDLAKLLGFEHLVIVPYHPQANGIVERRNTEVMKHLRALVYEKRIKSLWSRFLPLVQRIINYTVDGSIGTQPARVIFGNMLPMQIAMDLPENWLNRPVQDYLATLRAAQDVLVKATQQYLQEHHRKRTRSGKVPVLLGEPIEVGNYVLLRYPNRPPNKLAGLYRGPLVVVAKERDDIIEVLDLVSNRHMHVHVDRLAHFEAPEGMTKSQILELAGVDSDEFVVDFIVDHRQNGSNKRQWEFLVRWKGYEPDEDTWLPWSEVKDLAALDVYSEQHPELKLG
jgi:hypothetical protein